jgi:hypothetical protein
MLSGCIIISNNKSQQLPVGFGDSDGYQNKGLVSLVTIHTSKKTKKIGSAI